MRESGYYPPGAEFDPSAPYNEPVIPELDFDVTCTQTLTKTVTVYTSNYAEDVDEERDEEGHMCRTSYYDTSDTNWEEEYHNKDYHTPFQLIELFGRYLKDEIEHSGGISRQESYLKSLLKECNGWIEVETEFVND